MPGVHPALSKGPIATAIIVSVRKVTCTAVDMENMVMVWKFLKLIV